uniref:uncharacterized protein n=1 Tax=Semicossyphus pulcher TaxID=241346 RepID=UPI0037E98D4E
MSTTSMETRINEPALSTSGSGQQSPELRIVLIGGRELHGQPSTKRAAGNTILGQSVFDTSRRTGQSVVRQQEVHGRRVTVVNSPHWMWHYPRENTPLLDQMEIKNSVHLCPPGPHAFLLVIPASMMFPQVFVLSLMEHLQLFQENVLKHTIVLLTVEDQFGYQYLQNEVSVWPAYERLLEQCGNRKHVLNTNDLHDSAQVQTLLEKIEAMVAENAGGHFSVDRADGNALREKMEAIVEGASKRVAEVQRRRRELKALIEGGKTPPTHLRMVMVGAQWSAKSSAGKNILKKNAFAVLHRRSTERCAISHNMVANRQLTVVDSPGWFYNHTLQDTCEWDKLEIESSVHLCPPGPHAVLLVVGLSSAFNASYLRAVQEHMSLFTDDVWKHTVVLFTRGDWLGVKTVEERIESEEGLRWLVEKCGNKYHVLDNTNGRDRAQVTELLEKIEEMWAGNKEPHYEADPGRAEQIAARREAGDRMAKRMWQMTQRQERILTEVFRGEWRQVTDMRIVLVGSKGSGKSMAGNRILSEELFDPFMMKKEFQDRRRNMVCVKHKRNVSGVNVSVVETPGWLRDGKTPDWLKNEVLRSVSMCAPGPHAFLLVVPLSKAFTESDTKAVVDLLMPLGESVWRHCMLLFMWGDWLKDRSIEEYIAAEGENLKWLVEKCGNRYHVFCFRPFSFPLKELYQKINAMITRNKGCCFTTEDDLKKQKTLRFRWVKQPQLTEEEWNRREQELIDRVLKAVAQEPEEPTKPPVKMAASIDGAFIPSMSGDAPSEVGSTFWTQGTHARVSEWLRIRVGNSDVTSGIGCMSASGSCMSLDQSSVTDHYMTGCFFPETDKIKLDSVLHDAVSTDTVGTQRRHSF